MPISTVVLHQADRRFFLAALATFAGKNRTQWLGAGHSASNGQLPKTWTQVAQLPAQQVIDVLAASAPNHCIDAWSYVSRAVSSLLSGDGHACRHLAYYAQLRAGMCILANVGVGIFNRINFVVDATGAVQRLDPVPGGGNRGGIGTHEVVWDALNAWGTGVVTAQYFADAIKIRGVSLRDLLLIVWPGISIQNVASDIIQSWGLDLQRGKTDHSERNVSSYAQHALNPVNPPTNNVVTYVSETWKVLEPTSASAYDALDRYLLRALLQNHHRRVSGDTNYAAGPIGQRYAQLPQNLMSLVARDFLDGTVADPDPQVVRLALSNSSPAGPIEMLSRAILLVRAASGFTHTSFADAGINISAGAMRPWINQWAEERGFWSPSRPLVDPIDLWADIEIALLDLEQSINPPPNSMSDWIKKTQNGLPTIAEVERAGVWSLSA
ncbi:hypothetical protein [Methylobacterium radiodurans]|uniref:hypothetical protein n=1 Tax=Methylobacterium radiodurans TaxID=2202828 RepID=UPI0013A53727|nr:hypothetical protein [Methylobacterium radiodurans]